ncbi:30S ribosomal protein S8e [Candidatus Borrarchaeum sp.]|uniref:30S ribosomal protein S8e n=1 Tax=Candidatus Borrarchaeum sp. TaxID=2846742 RepID=UPI0025803723|nr:30S ribosomal protein S8e [Candidatus Borrarchaeum sp.]
MPIQQGRSKRKATGAKLRSFRKKKKYEIGREPVETKVGEEKKKKVRVRGGNFKIKLQAVRYVNVTDRGVTKKVRVLGVEENPANLDFTRRQIITKGTIIQTDIGLARVTSRPGQDGIINAVTVEVVD